MTTVDRVIAKDSVQQLLHSTIPGTTTSPSKTDRVSQQKYAIGSAVGSETCAPARPTDRVRRNIRVHGKPHFRFGRHLPRRGRMRALLNRRCCGLGSRFHLSVGPCPWISGGAVIWEQLTNESCVTVVGHV